MKRCPILAQTPSCPFPRRPEWTIGWLILPALAMIGGVYPIDNWPGLRIAGRIGSGFIAHILCSEIFVSGIDPADTYNAYIASNRLLGPLGVAIRTDVNHQRQEVQATVGGLFHSRARYAGETGCRLVRDASDERLVDELLAMSTRAAPAEEPPVVPPEHPMLSATLDAAFVEPAVGPPLRTRAVVVMREGRVIGEKYAPGIGPQTPLLGFSLTKSVTNALLGVLVQQGRLRTQDLAPIGSWRRSNDWRSAITIDQLLRMESGLAWYETLGAAGMDSATRMLWSEPDFVAFAENRSSDFAPGAYWRYSSGDTMVLSQIIHQSAGGDRFASLRFAREALFEPLGLRSARLSIDRGGAMVGAFGMFATARDWARFGALYANDGMVGDRRILPPGWVDYSASVSPRAPFGYGAHFWTMRSKTEDVADWMSAGIPADSLIAIGYFGQMIIISPAKKLVIVRLGVAPGGSAAVLPSLAPLLAATAAD